MPSKPPRCPNCGSDWVAEILYGLVTLDDDVRRELQSGEIVLGGCCIENDAPAWRCNDCEHEFGKAHI